MKRISKLHVDVPAKTEKSTVTAKCPSEGTVAGTFPFAVQLGKRLVSIRGRATQKDFARSLDIHKNSLIRYESGERLIDAWLISQLRVTHGVNPLWLLTGEGEPHGTPMTDFDPNVHRAPPMIPELLTATLHAVDQEIAAGALTLTTEQKAEVAVTVYGLVNTAVKDGDVDQLTRLKPADIRGAVGLILRLKGFYYPPPKE